MSDELMIRHCSPTLAGIKTGNLVSCTFGSKEQMMQILRQWNKRFTKKGLCILPLRYRDGMALVYLFRTEKLIQDLQNEKIRKLLKERGYVCDSLACCMLHLRKRLKESQEFPHEIGAFLGYPPEDVCGFIEQKAKNFKCVGCWKVYGNEEEAKKCFEQYRKCTKIYYNQYRMGKNIDRLIVSSKT